MIVSFANEMNGSWFPWSGILYGGGKPDPRHQSAALSKAPRLSRKPTGTSSIACAPGRDQRPMGAAPHELLAPQEEWNLAAQYYPGPEYCDWLGFSLYGAQFPADDEWAPFFRCSTGPTGTAPHRPHQADHDLRMGRRRIPDSSAAKPTGFATASALMKDPKYPRIKACVYLARALAKRRRRATATCASTPRPNPLEAYRQGVADPAVSRPPRSSRPPK